MQISKPRRPLGKICIIGATSNVGQSLMTHLTTSGIERVTLFAETAQQRCRLEAMIQDHLIQGIHASQDPRAVDDCETVVFIAGAKTALSGRKNDLFEVNRSIVDRYARRLSQKNIVLVTNPCTQLGRYLAASIDAFTIAIGVQNDLNRARFQDPRIAFAIGAHNVKEQVFFGQDGERIFDGFQCGDAYDRSRARQDTLLTIDDYAGLYEHLRQEDSLRWWRVQRYHSQINVSNYSCAKSIVDALKYVSGSDDKVFNAELSVALRSGRKYFIGLPVRRGALACPAQLLEDLISERRRDLEKYAI